MYTKQKNKICIKIKQYHSTNCIEIINIHTNAPFDFKKLHSDTHAQNEPIG